MNDALSSKRVTRFIPSLLVGLAAVVPYLQTLSFDYAYDDRSQITLNTQVLEAHSLVQLLFSPTPPGNLYRPLTTFTYVLNYRLADLDPGLYHFTNCALYLLCCLLLHALAARLLPATAALGGAMLFALHPIHTEAVANIIGRAEILAAIFAMLGILAHLTRAPLGAAVAAASFIAGALCKESALSLLLILPFMRPPERSLRTNLLRALPVAIAVGISYGALRWAALGPQFGVQSDPDVVWAENPLSHLPFHERLIPACVTLGRYLLLLFLPLHQSADYSLMPDRFSELVYSTSGAMALTTLCLYISALTPVVPSSGRIFGVWTLAAFASTSNILMPIGTIMGERLAFLPSAGFCLFLSVNLFRLPRRLGPAAVVMLGAGYSLLLLDRIPVWRNNLVLFEQTVLDSPASPKARYNLAVEYLVGTKKDLDRADVLLRETLALHPTHLLALRALADIALERRDLPRLEYWYRRILEVSPANAQVREQLETLLKLKVRQP